VAGLLTYAAGNGGKTVHRLKHIVETGPVEVLLERALHAVLSGVAGAEVVMVMGEDVPDDASIIWDIQ
jgi:hypothetical protein